MKDALSLLRLDMNEIIALDTPFQDAEPALSAPHPTAFSTLGHWVDSNGLLVMAVGLTLGLLYLFVAGVRQFLATKKQVVAAELARVDELREALKKAESEKEQLLALLRQRDRLMVQREAVVSTGECFVATWDEHNWKAAARMQLAMTRAVRPLLFADFRTRIQYLSPTYRLIPGPAMLALQNNEVLMASIGLDELLPAWPVEQVLPEPETLPMPAPELLWLVDEASEPVATYGNHITAESTKKQVVDELHYLWNASPVLAREARNDDNLTLVAVQQQAKELRAQRRAAFQKKSNTPNE